MLRLVSRSFVPSASGITDTWPVDEWLRRACQHSRKHAVRLLMASTAGLTLVKSQKWLNVAETDQTERKSKLGCL
jgi:hypothetical protein